MCMILKEIEIQLSSIPVLLCDNLSALMRTAKVKALRSSTSQRNIKRQYPMLLPCWYRISDRYKVLSSSLSVWN